MRPKVGVGKVDSSLPLTSEVYGSDFSGAMEGDLDRILPAIEQMFRAAYWARPVLSTEAARVTLRDGETDSKE